MTPTRTTLAAMAALLSTPAAAIPTPNGDPGTTEVWIGKSLAAVIDVCEMQDGKYAERVVWFNETSGVYTDFSNYSPHGLHEDNIGPLYGDCDDNELCLRVSPIRAMLYDYDDNTKRYKRKSNLECRWDASGSGDAFQVMWESALTYYYGRPPRKRTHLLACVQHQDSLPDLMDYKECRCDPSGTSQHTENKRVDELVYKDISGSWKSTAWVYLEHKKAYGCVDCSSDVIHQFSDKANLSGVSLNQHFRFQHHATYNDQKTLAGLLTEVSSLAGWDYRRAHTAQNDGAWPQRAPACPQ